MVGRPITTGRAYGLRMLAWFDTECFPNYWLLMVRPERGRTVSYRLHEQDSLVATDRLTIQSLFNTYTMISFNGLRYDVPMINLALQGATSAQLKLASNQMITQDLPHWKVIASTWQPPDHIDLWAVAPGQTSLKQYAARLHLPTLQDLPYDPDTHLTILQKAEVDRYCENDLDSLTALYHALQLQLHQRIILGKKYGLDLRSKADAQIAEAVLVKRCEELSGRPSGKAQCHDSATFHYHPPAFLTYHLPVLQDLLKQLSDIRFTSTLQEFQTLSAGIGGNRYTIGIGGLHSQEKSRSVIATTDRAIRDADVVSYYPQLILNSGLYPHQLGPAFQEIYRSLKEERLQAKTEQLRLQEAGLPYTDQAILNQGLKIQINGTFGKMGSRFSALFAPELLLYTTLTGQLALLMLIEWLELAAIPVISANTDGIVFSCPPARIRDSEQLIKQWEAATNLQMEPTDYRAIHLRDVNSYVAITTRGKIKRKGKFGQAGLTQMKNPDTEICTDAVVDWLAYRIPIEYTVAVCRDLRKFLKVVKVTGGGVKHHTPFFGQPFQEYVGKVVRWYYAKTCPGPILYHTNGHKVGKSEGAKPCMSLPSTFPDDLDYRWYIREAYELLGNME